MDEFSKYDDKQLIDFIHIGEKGSEDAFKEIYNRYSKRLFLYCRLKCEISPDAEDIHQEMWFSFYNTVRNGKVDIELPHYLYGIARNLVLQYRNKQNKHHTATIESRDLDAIVSPFIGLESSIEQKDLLQIINLASEYLSEKQKETFHLKWFLGLTSTEISNITGESIDCVKRRSHRAMDTILRLLEPFIKEIKKIR